ADLRDGLAFLLEFLSEQRLVHTDRAMRGVIVFETTVQTLVAHAAVAVAVARHLRDRYRNLARRAIGVASQAFKLLRRECWTKTRATRSCFVKSRHDLRPRRCRRGGV